MTTPDPDETPQPSRALLSAFLGGWARFQSKDGDKGGDSAADAEPGAESSAPNAESGEEPDGPAGVEDVQAAADAVGADDDGADTDGAADAQADEDGHDDSVEELAELAELADLAELDDEDADLDDHVIEVADPRDFADDAGPLYELSLIHI